MSRQMLHPHTEKINKKYKARSHQAKKIALDWLALTFPQAFDITSRIRPLKRGIINDILLYAESALKQGISRSKLREAVALFARRLDYLICLKAKEMRIDLEGNVIEEVTPEEAEKAALKIKKRIEKNLRNVPKPSICKEPSPPFKSSNTLTKDRQASDFEYPYREYEIRPPKTTEVFVKQKTTRQYDPDAVAKLKEKLGIARKKLTES